MLVGLLLNSPRVVPPATSAIFVFYAADHHFVQAMRQQKAQLMLEEVELRRLLSEEKTRTAGLRDSIAKMICE